jgi:hypothetical protein
MTLSAADMLSVQLKILGDPQFIKQDDAFYTPSVATTSADLRLTPNGSLRTDYQEIYVKVLFRTPVDIDESTGMMDFGTNYRTSVFSGLYKVLTITSEFRNGQFTQTLDLIRLPYQPMYDYATQPKTATNQRGTDITPSSIVAQNTSINVKNISIPNQLPMANDIGLNPINNQQLQTAASNIIDKIPTLQRDLMALNKRIPAVPSQPSDAPIAIPRITRT